MGKSEVLMITRTGHMFKCMHCSYRISSKKGISLHLKYSHKAMNLKEGGEEHACNTCGQVFGSLFLTRKHMLGGCKNT